MAEKRRKIKSSSSHLEDPQYTIDAEIGLTEEIVRTSRLDSDTEFRRVALEMHHQGQSMINMALTMLLGSQAAAGSSLDNQGFRKRSRSTRTPRQQRK